MMIFQSLLLTVLSLLVTASSAAPSLRIPRGGGGRSAVEKSQTTTYWEEEIPAPRPDKDPSSSSKKDDKDARPLFWTPTKQKSKPKRVVKTQHPMRTNKWEIRFTTRNRKLFANRTLEMEFDDKLGYCKAAPQKGEAEAAVGKWHMIPAGILWRYSDDESSNRLLHFTAEIHLNPFGDHPRMLRGVVVRDRYVM